MMVAIVVDIGVMVLWLIVTISPMDNLMINDGSDNPSDYSAINHDDINL